MDDLSLMPFGKHKGERMIDVPAAYLLWCYDQSWCRGPVKKYIQERKEILEEEVEQEKFDNRS